MKDIIEYEEDNFEELFEDFLLEKENKKAFQEWLDLEGYDLFLKENKERWNEFVEREFNEQEHKWK